jgi:membrane-bound ClpP family serine protease
MTLIVLLFTVGVLLLAAEVILPGGVIGAVGGLMMFAGCVVAFMRLGAGGGSIAVVTALVLAGIVIFLELRIVPKTKLGRRAFLDQAITGVSAPVTADLDALTGKPAEALTTLAPSGYVLVEGHRHEAFCRSGHAEKGARLEVIGSENQRLIVTRKDHA